ncbi:M15 family metallopeptidase, partial [Candidatus Babeliales bacterium]|nr:M15 family metallopeptidase [Candidatus Babeliales bacterium]
KLDLVQKEFLKQGLGLLIGDAFRPLAVQRILWDINPDENFVANPDKGGGRHTRGTAVDLTLINLETGEMLKMPSEVSDFSRCRRNRQDMSPTGRKNMLLLEGIMKKHGFLPLASEWWHFDLAGWRSYPAIDLDFDEIEAQKT